MKITKAQAETMRVLLAEFDSKSKAKAPKAKKAAKVGRKCLIRRNRLAFIKAAAKDGWDFSTMSVRDIAAWCVENDYRPAGYKIGSGYRNLVG